MLRLTSATDFERVRRDGRSYAHPLIVLVACRAGSGEGAVGDPTLVRFGFTAGRSVGSAVRRNRAKRLLRAAARALSAQITPGWDLVLIARAPIAGCKMHTVRDALAQLLRKARVLEPAR